MADVTSTLISNRAATPRVANDPWTNAVMKTTGLGIIEGSTDEDSGDVLSFCTVKSNAVVKLVILSCDAIASTGAMDIGLYQTADNGGAVVDADFFGSAVVLTSALSNSDVTHESGVYGIEDGNKPLWEALGLTEDPQIDYVIAGTLTADLGGAGTICVEAIYADGGA
jgi:hypothetical protein